MPCPLPVLIGALSCSGSMRTKSSDVGSRLLLRIETYLWWRRANPASTLRLPGVERVNIQRSSRPEGCGSEASQPLSAVRRSVLTSSRTRFRMRWCCASRYGQNSLLARHRSSTSNSRRPDTKNDMMVRNIASASSQRGASGSKGRRSSESVSRLKSHHSVSDAERSRSDNSSCAISNRVG